MAALDEFDITALQAVSLFLRVEWLELFAQAKMDSDR